MSEEQALIVVERLNPIEIFQNGGMDKILKEIESKVEGIVFDVSTEEGRKECASMAYKVARSKTLIDNMGKELVADWKKKAKVVDAERKKARDFLDPLKDRVREPLTEYEAEQERIKKEEEERERRKCEARIEELQKYGKVMSFFDVAALTDDEYTDILNQAKADHASEQKRLEDERLAREAEAKKLAEERAELEKLRAEQAERDRIEREKQDAERRKLEDERKAIEAEKARIAEAVKQAAEEARVRAEAEAKARAEREAGEAKERQVAAEKARQESLKPDKEKLITYLDSLLEIPEPELGDEANKVLGWFSDELAEIVDKAKWGVKSL